MSGGSGCQQIKLFVFRPGFSTLSLHPASVSLPVTLCLSLYLSSSSLGPLFFIFLSLSFSFCATGQPPALPLLNCYSASSLLLPAPPFLRCFLCACTRCSMMRLVFADEARLFMPCVCVMTLVFADEASVCMCVFVSVCVCCQAQHDGTGLC